MNNNKTKWSVETWKNAIIVSFIENDNRPRTREEIKLAAAEWLVTNEVPYDE